MRQAVVPSYIYRQLPLQAFTATYETGSHDSLSYLYVHFLLLHD